MKYSYFSQKDSNWGGLKIPGTALYLRAWGCAICSLAMIANYYGKGESPKSILTKLRYNSSGAVYWDSLTKKYPDIKFIQRVFCRNTPAPTTVINSYLSQGFPVIAEVDASARAGLQQHFVCIFAKNGDDYKICDPLFVAKNKTEEVQSFKKRYGKPSRFIYGLVFYKGIVAKPKPKPKPIPTCPAPDCPKEKAEIASLMSEIRELTQTITSLKKAHSDALGASNKQAKRLEEDLKSLRITHKEEIKQKDDFANNIEREKIALKNDFDGKEEVLGKELVRVNLKADDLIEELKEARKKEKAIYSLKVKKYLLKIYKKK